MLRAAWILSLVPLALTAGMPKGSRDALRPGVTYLYTYYDPQGRLLINNLPPSFMQNKGLVLKHVGVGKVRLAITFAENLLPEKYTWFNFHAFELHPLWLRVCNTSLFHARNRRRV